MRILLDTCVIIDWLTDTDLFDDSVWDILNDPNNKLYVSTETARELIVSFNNKKLLSKYWKSAEEMLLAMKEEAMVDILPITERCSPIHVLCLMRRRIIAILLTTLLSHMPLLKGLHFCQAIINSLSTVIKG